MAYGTKILLYDIRPKLFNLIKNVSPPCELSNTRDHVVLFVFWLIKVKSKTCVLQLNTRLGGTLHVLVIRGGNPVNRIPATPALCVLFGRGGGERGGGLGYLSAWQTAPETGDGSVNVLYFLSLL